MLIERKSGIEIRGEKLSTGKLGNFTVGKSTSTYHFLSDAQRVLNQRVSEKLNGKK